MKKLLLLLLFIPLVSFGQNDFRKMFFGESKEVLKEKYPDTVELVGYKCSKGHGTAHNDCKLNKTKKIIENYFQNSK